jgi:hypothetical protein
MVYGSAMEAGEIKSNETVVKQAGKPGEKRAGNWKASEKNETIYCLAMRDGR